MAILWTGNICYCKREDTGSQQPLMTQHSVSMMVVIMWNCCLSHLPCVCLDSRHRSWNLSSMHHTNLSFMSRHLQFCFLTLRQWNRWGFVASKSNLNFTLHRRCWHTGDNWYLLRIDQASSTVWLSLLTQQSTTKTTASGLTSLWRLHTVSSWGQEDLKTLALAHKLTARIPDLEYWCKASAVKCS